MKRCRVCNKDVYGDADICPECRSKMLTPNCRHYTELEKSCTVPYCKLHNKEILGMAKLFKCPQCEDKEE